MSDLLHTLVTGGGRTRVAVLAAGAVTLPPALLLFLCTPTLFSTLSFPALVLLALAIGFPALLISAVSNAILSSPSTPPDPTKQRTDSDVWADLAGASVLSSIVIYACCIVALLVAPLALGRTLLLAFAIQLAFALLVAWIQGARSDSASSSQRGPTTPSP